MAKVKMTRSDEALVRMTLNHVAVRGLDPVKCKALAEQWVHSVSNQPRYMQAACLAAQVAALVVAGW